MSLEAFTLDLSKTDEGDWFKVGTDMEFLLASIGNDNWQKQYTKLEARAYGSQKRQESARDDETDANIILECFARTCILDWKGVTFEGKDVPFSTDKAVEVVLDRKPSLQSLLP
jgi:hypothetical protein